MCVDCGFQPYCGSDPVYHHATQGDAVGFKPSSGFCRKNMGIMRHLIRLLEDDERAASVLEGMALRGRRRMIKLHARLARRERRGALRRPRRAGRFWAPAGPRGVRSSSRRTARAMAPGYRAYLMAGEVERRRGRTPGRSPGRCTVPRRRRRHPDQPAFRRPLGDVPEGGRVERHALTERCNSYCVMCSQPPKAARDDHLARGRTWRPSR